MTDVCDSCQQPFDWTERPILCPHCGAENIRPETTLGTATLGDVAASGPVDQADGAAAETNGEESETPARETTSIDRRQERAVAPPAQPRRADDPPPKKKAKKKRRN